MSVSAGQRPSIPQRKKALEYRLWAVSETLRVVREALRTVLEALSVSLVAAVVIYVVVGIAGGHPVVIPLELLERQPSYLP